MYKHKYTIINCYYFIQILTIQFKTFLHICTDHDQMCIICIYILYIHEPSIYSLKTETDKLYTFHLYTNRCFALHTYNGQLHTLHSQTIYIYSIEHIAK